MLISTLTLVPLLCSVNFSVKISRETQTVYDYLENMFVNGKNILVDIHYSVSLRAILEPQLAVLTKYFFDKNCKIIFISTSTNGPAMFEKFQFSASDIFANKHYGVDYVFLGKIDHDEIAVSSLAVNLSQTLSKDYFNNSITDYVKLPVMRDINDAEDFALVLILSVEVDVFEWYARHWATRGVPFLICTLRVIAPLVEKFVRGGQAIGVIDGYDATAEYELLIGKVGKGCTAIKNKSVANLLTIAFMFFANILLFYIKSKSQSIYLKNDQALPRTL